MLLTFRATRTSRILSDPRGGNLAIKITQPNLGCTEPAGANALCDATIPSSSWRVASRNTRLPRTTDGSQRYSCKIGYMPKYAMLP